jgi:hypothetical protein
MMVLGHAAGSLKVGFGLDKYDKQFVQETYYAEEYTSYDPPASPSVERNKFDNYALLMMSSFVWY